MRAVAALMTLFVASSALLADDAGEDQSPVTAIVPVGTAPVAAIVPVQNVITLTPIVVSLLSVLASPVPSPAQIQALVSELTPAQVSAVVVSLASNSAALSALVAAMSSSQIAATAEAVMNTPAAYSAFVAQLSVSQLTAVVGALQNSPSAISALAATMSVEQTAQVMARLADVPGALAVVAAQLDPGKLAQVKIELFLADIEGWEKVSAFLNPPDAPKKKFGGNWLDAARAALRTKIARDGYSPKHLLEARSIMQKAGIP